MHVSAKHYKDICCCQTFWLGKETDLIAKLAKHRFNRTEEEGEGRFELKLIKKGFEGQEVTILKEILDLCYILVKLTFVEYRFTIYVITGIKVKTS